MRAKASPDDFLALARDANTSSRSGDSPPPPERKQYSSDATNADNGPPSPSSKSSTVSSNNSKQRRDRYGLGGGISNDEQRPMKFQFYVPTAGSGRSSQSQAQEQHGGSSAAAGAAADAGSLSDNNSNWGSHRSGTSRERSGFDLERISDDRVGRGGGGGGNNNSHHGHKKQQNTTTTGGGGSKQKGIDPPEKELPTSMIMTAEESARKARSRLIQLQHRESHASSSSGAHPSHNHVSSGTPQMISNSGGKESSLVSDSSRSKKSRRSRAGTGSSFCGLDSIDSENEHGDDDDDDDDDDDFPLVAMDPIESDDEPMSDHYEEKGLSRSQHSGRQPTLVKQQKQQQRYRSPVQNRQNDQLSYMKTHPSSAPQRPSHRLPPQQLMQYLHAGGRGSFGRQGPQQGGGGGGVFPLPLNNNGLPNSNNPNNPNQPHNSMQHFPRQSQGQQYMHQQHRNSNAKQQRRLSDNTGRLYSDGIDLLEKAANEAREREEVDTLNDGIHYLRKLETALEKGESGSGSQSQGQQQQQYAMTPPRKGATPPFKGQAVVARPQHRPPPEKKSDGMNITRSRSSTLGDEMEKLAIQSHEQQQQGQHHGAVRIHRPPPRAPLSNPTTPTQHHKRPVITAAAAMDFVMSASALPLGYNDVEDNDNRNGDREAGQDVDEVGTTDGNDKIQSYFNAVMLREDGGDSNSGHGSFDSNDSGGNDDSESEESDVEDDDFERNTSLSMHAEAKYKPSSRSSRYAEDKHGLSKSMSRVDRIQQDDSPQHVAPQHVRHGSDPAIHMIRKGGGGRSTNMSGKSMDPPDVDGDDDEDLEIDNEHSDRISPAVLPMKTMNERLYAIETVIPTPPTRYHEEFADEVDSFDQGMPRLAPHEDGSAPSHALGPRSQRPGGITGVVLDVGSDENRDYPRPTLMERERLRPHSPSESSQSSSEDDPQSVIGDDPLDGVSHGDLDKYSWSGEMSGEGGGRQATSLMMKLCSHLLPVGLDAFDHRKDNSSLTSLILQNKSSLEWDDDDPDDTGYVVHRLTNSQLISVESAFEKMVASLERSSEKHVRDGSNDKNFERDLEEAEMILDQEEKRYESEVKAKISDGDSNIPKGMELQTKRQDNEVRESVPDFPGIYPPGKGKTGEMECFYLPIITKSQKTGFEPTKDLVLKPGSVFANNYLVQSELGSAAFSTAYRCLDLSSEEDEDGYQDEVCLKVIKNTKDYFDQSIDEIKILQLLKDTGRVQENNVVEMRSFFYHREHLVIVTELLRQNLYEFGKSILESRGPLYFTRLRLSHITRQCLISLKFVHELGLMHCDIKPENILLSSYSRALVKVIDFGSSSFVTDRQSSYIQSRSYRAPEVVLGLPYGGKIDMWSLGCVIAELYTNEVTFQNDSELSMLSRIEAICGPFPRHMIAKGRNSHRIFTDSGLIYEKISSDDVEEDRSQGSSDDETDKTMFNVYQPKMTTIAARLGFDEDFMDQPRLSEDDKKRALFVDFVSKLLTIDPDGRPSAAEALDHPWITSSLDLSEGDIRYGQ